MTESVRFHIGLASAANAPTEFRMLNGKRNEQTLSQHVYIKDLDQRLCLTIRF